MVDMCSIDGGGLCSRDATYSEGCQTKGCSSGVDDHEVTQTSLSFVGPGRGQYIQETTYKYVGDGSGEFDMMGQQANKFDPSKYLCCLHPNFPLCFFPAILALSLLAIMAWLLMRRDNQFTCHLGDDGAWQTKWSRGKKAWCCKREGKGCSTFDCHVDLDNWESGWDSDKKRWCCSSFQLGCQDSGKSKRCSGSDCTANQVAAVQEHNCNVGLVNWWASWTADKRDWCCEHAKRGCPGSEPEEALRHKSIQRSSSTTDNAGAEYRCDVGFSNWAQGWSEEKKAWCCQHGGRGCPTTSSALFNCKAGASNWELGWATNKKLWCCKHERVGCYVASTTASSDYDCLLQFSTWKEAWSEKKKEWCCKHRSRGCPNSTFSDPYDCIAGFSTWERSWSLGKKAWCCLHKKRGCVPAASEPYDCLAGYIDWRKGWSLRKKDWCCSNKDRGCPNS